MAGVEFIGAERSTSTGHERLTPLDLAIDGGESLVLVGPSGAANPHCSAC